MALETGSFISDLIASNPTNTDLKSQGDDHLRLLKKVIKASFPAVTGAVSKSHLEINASHDQRVPVGGIIMWSGAQINIPSGWLLCNGLSGTPNLMDRFVMGAGNAYAVGATGGAKDAIVVAHTHAATLTGTTAGGGSHSHAITDSGHSHSYDNGLGNASGSVAAGYDGGSLGTKTTAAATTGITIAAVGTHTHTVSATGTTDSAGAAALDANLPPYYALCFIMKSA